MRPPTTKKEVQKLTGCLAALSRFIVRLGEKGLPLFKLLGIEFQVMLSEVVECFLQVGDMIKFFRRIFWLSPDQYVFRR